jgi:hypothetical protein
MNKLTPRGSPCGLGLRFLGILFFKVLSLKHSRSYFSFEVNYSGEDHILKARSISLVA